MFTLHGAEIPKNRTQLIEQGEAVDYTSNIEEMTNAEREAYEYLQRNQTEIDKSKTACVDGRYAKDQDPGAISRPGADLGLVMALLKIKNEKPELGLTVQGCFDSVYSFVTQEEKRQFCWHSDTHADPIVQAEVGVDEHQHSEEKPLIGCGHCLKSSLNSVIYGVNKQDIEELVAIIRAKQVEDPDNMHFINLDGSHGESMILRNQGTDKTVLHWDTETNKMVFVYDQAVDKSIIANLERSLQTKGVQIASGDVLKAADAQTDSTLKLLASGKTVIDFKIEDGKIQVRQAGKIPVIA